MIKEFINTSYLEAKFARAFVFLSPNTWTTLSLVAALAAYLAVSHSRPVLGVALFAVSGLLDIIDGMVARFSGRVSRLGAFWDGVVDRFVDALLILCFFSLSFPVRAETLHMLLFALLFATLLPPFIVAYANHRGAVPDPSEKEIWRFAFRIEYLIIYLLVILLNPLSSTASYILLWTGMALMWATVIQSIVLVFIKSKKYGSTTSAGES